MNKFFISGFSSSYEQVDSNCSSGKSSSSTNLISAYFSTSCFSLSICSLNRYESSIYSFSLYKIIYLFKKVIYNFKNATHIPEEEVVVDLVNFLLII